MVLATVEIAGPNSIEIHTGGSTIDTNYSAIVKDSASDVMAGEAVTWSLKSAVSGVAIDSSTGIVTINNTSPAYSFTIVATSQSDPSKSAEKTVSIT